MLCLCELAASGGQENLQLKGIGKMEQNCKDCVYIINLDKRVVALESEVEEIKKEISDIKQLNARAEEKFDRIFNILETIQKTIDKIASKIEELEKKPALRWESIITALTTGAVAFLLAKILK